MRSTDNLVTWTKRRLSTPNAAPINERHYFDVKIKYLDIKLYLLILGDAYAQRGRVLMPPGRTNSVEYLAASEQQASRAYSPAIVTCGGRTVYLAGQTALADVEGKSLVGDFEGQTHTIFALIDKTLRQVGGTLHNLVTMTVFINDPRYGDRFVELRKTYFPAGRYPCSALITVSDFARPGMVIEIQGIAVIPD